MKDIVNIQITPIKNIVVNPLGSLIEKFNPNEYTPIQTDKLKKKGYVESIDFEPTTDTQTNDSKTNTSSNQTSSQTSSNQIPSKQLQGTPMGWTNEERKAFLQSLVQNKQKATNENPKVISNMNALINDLSQDIINNKNFTGAGASTTNINQMTNKAINEKLLEAEKKYANLTGQVQNTNKSTIDQLKAEYEGKIRKWTDDYQKSISYYKEYIKNQEGLSAELKNQNLTLSDAMQRNTDKLNALAKKWDSAQKKINNFEKELLQSNSKKYDEIIKNLKQQLAAEKAKQLNIDEKIAQLRAEKAQLDAMFAENVEKLKKAGLGSNCPKDFNMNDYIHKKKIPCWGCIL